MTTEKNNELIAKFMGYEVKYNKCYSPKYNDGSIAPMQFHKSWDWLIPTIKKIYNDFSIDDEHILLIRDALAEADFDNAYKNVVNFINQTP